MPFGQKMTCILKYFCQNPAGVITKTFLEKTKLVEYKNKNWVT